MGRYQGIDFSPPQGVRDACARGLDLHEQGHSGDGLRPATVAWARRLAAGEDVTPDKAVKMRAWFARHDNETENAARAEDPKSPAMVAWLLWGGDPGKRWSERLVAQMERADEEAETVSKRVTGPAERRAFSFEVKEFDDATGVIKGYANTWDRDSYGDEVQPGAFKRTLDHKRSSGKRIPIFSQHDPNQIIGYADPALAYEDAKGLWIEVQMLLEIQQAKDDYVRAKAGLMSFSIGYDPKKAEIDPKTKTRKLFEIALWEVSLVTFPANEHAVVTDVKAADFAGILAQQQVEENLYDTRWKLERALSSAIYGAMSDDDMDDEAKLAAADASLTQWHQAMLAWLRRALAAGLFNEKAGTGAAEHKAGRRHSASTVAELEAAMNAARTAADKLSALLGPSADDEDADPPADGEADPMDGKTKSAPTPGPDADVARLADEIKAAADSQAFELKLAELVAATKSAN